MGDLQSRIVEQEENVSLKHLIFWDLPSTVAKLEREVSCQRSVKIIAGIYKKYFDIMQERGWEVISPKPTIGRFGKLALAVKALLAS